MLYINTLRVFTMIICCCKFTNFFNTTHCYTIKNRQTFVLQIFAHVFIFSFAFKLVYSTTTFFVYLLPMRMR